MAKAARDAQATEAEKDRAQQLMLTDRSITANKALETARQEFQRGENVLDRTQQANLASAAQTFQATQAEKDRAQQLMLTDRTITANKALETARQEFQKTENAADRTQQQNLETARQNYQTTQANLDRTHQESMTRLANNLSTAQIPSTFAANVTSSTSSTINAIMADGNLTPEAKNAAIDNVIANANSTLQWGSTFYNTPMTGFARTGTGSTITPGANVAGLKAAIQSGASNADAGTAAGLAYAQRMGLTPDQTVSMWNQAMGTNFTMADYNRITQAPPPPPVNTPPGAPGYVGPPAPGGGGGGGIIETAVMDRDAWGRLPGNPMYGQDPNNDGNSTA